jgi:hypothetical protein
MQEGAYGTVRQRMASLILLGLNMPGIASTLRNMVNT